MADGTILKCHNFPVSGNFFENIDQPPSIGTLETPIGNQCGINSCMLQYDFLAEGFIPEIDTFPNYAEVLGKNREKLFNPKFLDAFRFKFPETHGKLSLQSERDFLMEDVNSLIRQRKYLRSIYFDLEKQIQNQRELDQQNSTQQHSPRRILLAFFAGADENQTKLPAFYETFIDELEKRGHQIFLAPHNIFDVGEWGAPPENIKHQIVQFDPELCIIFNNMFFDLSECVDCPILIWTVDSSIYCANYDAIRRNPSRYLFCTDDSSAKFFKDSFGANANQIHPLVYFSTFEAQNLPVTDNIVFIGSRFLSFDRTCIAKFLEENPTDAERKEFQFGLECLRQNPFLTAEEFLQQKILKSDKVIRNFGIWELLMELSDEKRIRVLSAISDLGLKLYGTPNWANGTHFYESNLQLCYTSKKISSREEVQEVYNSSKIGISTGHLQSVNGFPWRTFDIMRTNACLVSDFHEDCQKLFPMELFPIYHSPAEARSIIKELLDNEKLRRKIVKNCQQYAREHFTFQNVVDAVQNLTNISL